MAVIEGVIEELEGLSDLLGCSSFFSWFIGAILKLYC